MSILLPFCIYHYTDPETNTLRGYIGVAEAVVQRDKISIECSEESRPYKPYWNYYGTFFAVRPTFRPIPPGMRIFCAMRNPSYPYNTISVQPSYDPFDIQPNCVYFMAWGQPVPFTVPLYLHTRSGAIRNVYPSFDKKPPNDLEWKKEELSPIFVLTHTQDVTQKICDPESCFDLNKIQNIKFRCENGRCIPDPHGTQDLATCLVPCSNLPGERPLRMIDRLKAVGDISQPWDVPKIIRKTPAFVLAIFVGLFVLAIIVIVFILFRKK